MSNKKAPLTMSVVVVVFDGLVVVVVVVDIVGRKVRENVIWVDR